MSCAFPCENGCGAEIRKEWSRGLWYLRWWCHRFQSGIAMREPNQKEPSESES